MDIPRSRSDEVVDTRRGASGQRNVFEEGSRAASR
jgi:hypothetical protein